MFGGVARGVKKGKRQKMGWIIINDYNSSNNIDTYLVLTVGSAVRLEKD